MGEDTRAIEGQIEDTRERMGDTVAALSYKADVPSRVKDSMSEKKDAVTGKLSSAKDAVVGSAGDAARGAPGRVEAGRRDRSAEPARSCDRRHRGRLRGGIA